MATKGHVLVTGGAGYLGAHTVLALREAGWLVTALDDRSSPGTGRRSHLADRFVSLDVRDTSALRALLTNRPTDAVVHLAGRFGPRESIEAPEMAGQILAGGTASLLHAMLAAGVRRLVARSQLAVYGVPSGRDVTEATERRPTTPLGRVLAYVEDLVTDCREAWGLEAVCLRLGHLGGAASHRLRDRPDRPLPRLVRSARSGQPRHAFSLEGRRQDGRRRVRRLDLLHVEDAARAIVAALDALDGGPPRASAFNVSAGTSVGLDELVEQISVIAGRPCPVVEVDLPGALPLALSASPARFVEWAGWRPEGSETPAILRSAWEVFEG